MIHVQLIKPDALLRALQVGRGGEGELQEEAGMPLLQHLPFSVRGKMFQRVLADRLQHAEAWLAARVVHHQQTLFGQ